MKSSARGLTTATVALAAALGLSLIGPHRAGASPETLAPAPQNDSGLAVTILSPVPRTAFSGIKPVEISAFYQGSSSNPVATLELYVDGAKAATKRLDAPETRGVVSFLIDASVLTSGTHRIVIRATGADAEVTSAKSSFIYGDSGVSDMLARPQLDLQHTTPELSFLSPALDGKVEGTVTVKVSATDPNGKSPYVSFFVDRAFKTLKNYPPYEFEWDTTTYTNGFHTIEVFGYNDSQNVGHAKPLRVYVNNPGGRTEIRTDLKDAITAKSAAVPRRIAQSSALMARKKSAKTIHHSEALLAAPSASLSQVASGLALAHASLAPNAPQLSDPFVAAPAAQPVKPRKSAPGFKPMPVKLASPALLASVPDAHSKETNLPLIHMADAGLSAEGLSSPFLSAPSIAAAAVPHAAISAVVKTPLVKAGSPHFAVHTAGTAAAASLLRSKGQMSILFNNVALRIDRPLTAQNGLMFGPLRQIFEFQGGTLDWNGLTNTVTAKSETKEISLTIGAKSATVNKQVISLEAAPYLNQGRTMVPLSFLPAALDVNVQYDSATGHLLITSKQ